MGGHRVASDQNTTTIEELRQRLEEAEAALRALGAGEVDAVFVAGENEQVYTLEKADSPYRLLVEEMPQAAATLTAEGIILYCNRRFAGLLNRPLQDIIRKPILDFLSMEDRPRLAAMLKCGHSEEEKGEFTLLRADAAPIALYLGISTFTGGALGQCLLLSDLTEQRNYQRLQSTQAALRASEERFRTLADASPQMIWSVDGDDKVQYINAFGTEYTGFTREQMRDPKQVRRIIHPDDYEQVMRNWEQARAAEGTFEAELRLRRASDGSFRWFLSRSVPLRDERGQISQRLGVSFDIEDRKRTEQALQEADRRKDEFLATLAHELRSPLAPIQSAVHFLGIKSPALPELQWAQGVIDRQVRLMARLLEDLLDVSSISRRRLELRRECVELSAVIEAAVETSRPVIEAGEHELTVSLPMEPVYLDADRVRLSQVFFNLLNNAARYTEKGGHISLTAVRQGSEVLVSVKDSGLGIPAEMLPRIYDMFSQGKPAIEQSVAQRGLGIGLSLVKGLVELHGGAIDVSSAGTGKGSEFVVHLPTALETPEHAALRGSQGREDPPASQDRKRILVVDDSRDAADSLAMLLSSMGHEVNTVYDGEQAVEAARSWQPRVVLLDIGMPRIDGYEACRRIREQPWGREMFVIALTGWGQEADRRRSKDAGFDHHLVKPVDVAELMKLLPTDQPLPVDQ